MCTNAENVLKVIEAIFTGYFKISQTNSEPYFLMPDFSFLHLAIPVLILHLLVLLNKKDKILLPIC